MSGIKWLKYRDRVLDAWVDQHWQATETVFFQLKSVRDRSIHISQPVELDGQFVEALTERELVPIFLKTPAILLIKGEGGAGKTSLACQIALLGLRQQLATHRMLPVLIEDELDEKGTLFEVIRGKLNALTNQPEPIAPDLLERLLRRKRVLVVVDHFSEMSEMTRRQVRPDLSNFPIQALVITSRLPEKLGSIPKTELEPLRIEGNRLSQFLDAYLGKMKKRDLFEDEDYFDACRRLSRMVRQRNITLLLARLYADEMIKQQQGAGGTIPSSVPELMLSYLNQLNNTIESANKQDNLEVHRDAQIVAWECLRRTYQPTEVGRARVLSVLDAQNNLEASAKLTYLESRLRLLDIREPGDKVRIVLDPLAEYLAALYLVENCRKQPELRWSTFLNSIDQILEDTNTKPEAIQGFVLAVRDCCMARQQEAQVPDYVPEMLAHKAGLDPKELRKIEEKRRVRLLISELSAPELKYRIRAAEDLGQRGRSAAIAVHNLLGMVKNSNQIIEARQAATRALGQLGNCSVGMRSDIVTHLLLLLKKDDEEPALRRTVAESLGVLKTGESELLDILEDDVQPLEVRQGAARALSFIGSPSGQSVPMLIGQLQSGQIKTQVNRVVVWKEPVKESLFLELVEIPSGEFLMGSPPDEVGRDNYPYNFSETEGVDVEMHHPVTIRPFLMSRYSITQAQWRAVAALPKINQDLNPDPANFKGDNRPVEVISWYEAVEFCGRLSQYTDNSYRLPSESEWEYACRAGTTSTFHTGSTLSPDLENYDCRYAYGNGLTGPYRQETTEVGSFGIVNAFGLSDMHGNVGEWCLDHWHPSYRNAPSDGSAWITDGDARYRVVRGGAWNYSPADCRSSVRSRNSSLNRRLYLGFRVVTVSSLS
ncbi:MAG: SUMF1/EgtB/PvdO family nonheme iron enzyme [Cyanobacteria bacterium P01_D01_bin.36]